MAHLADLRAEVAHLEGDALDAWLAALADDWRSAELDPVDRALCEWAERLTLQPAACDAADVGRLRALGLDDAAIHRAAQVIAYFNYINRLADGLGVDLEPEMPPDPRSGGSRG